MYSLLAYSKRLPMATKSPNQKNSTKSCCFRMLSRGSKGADALCTWHFSILLLHPLRRCVRLSSFVGLRRWCPHRWSAAPESISQASDGLKPRHFRAGAMSTVRYQKRQKVSRLEPSALLKANHSEIQCLSFGEAFCFHQFIVLAYSHLCQGKNQAHIQSSQFWT